MPSRGSHKTEQRVALGPREASYTNGRGGKAAARERVLGARKVDGELEHALSRSHAGRATDLLYKFLVVKSSQHVAVPGKSQSQRAETASVHRLLRGQCTPGSASPLFRQVLISLSLLESNTSITRTFSRCCVVLHPAVHLLTLACVLHPRSQHTLTVTERLFTLILRPNAHVSRASSVKIEVSPNTHFTHSAAPTSGHQLRRPRHLATPVGLIPTTAHRRVENRGARR